MSCVTPSFCVAVGQTKHPAGETNLVEVWNGQAWKITNVPTSSESFLYDVSCVSTVACVAVGNAGFGQEALHWNGSTWTLHLLPTPMYNKWLSGVSCITATNCTAVGSLFLADGSRNVPYIMHWDGTRWQRMTDGWTSFDDAELSQVACTSATRCVAVGSWQGPQRASQRLLEEWNGHTWTVDPVPVPGGVHSSLGGVTCGAQGCVAVGNLINPDHTDTPYIVRYDGTRWSPDHPAPSAKAESALSGVSCTATGACVTVGEQWTSPGSPDQRPFVERSN